MEQLEAMGLTKEQGQAVLKEAAAALATARADVLSARKEGIIQLALVSANAKNAKAVLALMDASALEMQEDGTVSGLTKAIEGVKKTDGYLFADTPSAPPIGGFNPAAPPPISNGDMGLQGAVSAYYNQTN